MEYTKKRPDGIVLTKKVSWDDKVQIAQLENDKWKKVEEKPEPKAKKSKAKWTK